MPPEAGVVAGPWSRPNRSGRRASGRRRTRRPDATLEGTGHYAVERPDALPRALLDFLESLQEPRWPSVPPVSSDARASAERRYE